MSGCCPGREGPGEDRSVYFLDVGYHSPFPIVGTLRWQWSNKGTGTLFRTHLWQVCGRRQLPLEYFSPGISGHSTSGREAIPEFLTRRQWHRRVLALALPIIAANLTQPLLSIVDTAIAGHLAAPSALAGVALGGLFFNIVYWAFGFLRMATTGLIAQAHGADDPPALRATLVRALALGLGIGAALVAVKMPLVAGALDLLGGSADASAAAHDYCAARLWAAPMALGNYVVLGYLLGRQRATTALLIQAFINLANMAAAAGFVYGLDWGVEGLGAATALADLLGFALGAAILWRSRAPGLGPLIWRDLAERAALARLILVNRDIFLRTLCLLACFAWFTHEGARRGDAILAANALLMNLQTFMAYVLDGFAQAAESLVGAAIGARARRDYDLALRISTFWGGGERRGVLARLCGPRAFDRLRLDRPGRGAHGGADLSALGGAFADRLGMELPARWHLYRRNANQGSQEHDGAGDGLFSRHHLGAPARLRQSRPVGGADGADAGPRRRARPAAAAHRADGIRGVALSRRRGARRSARYPRP